MSKMDKHEQSIEQWFAISGERTRMRLEKLPGGDGRYDQKTAIVEQYNSLTSTWNVFLTGTGNTWEEAVYKLALANTGRLIGRGNEEPVEEIPAYEVHVNAEGADIVEGTIRGPDALERAQAIVAAHKAGGEDAYYKKAEGPFMRPLNR